MLQLVQVSMVKTRIVVRCSKTVYEIRWTWGSHDVYWRNAKRSIIFDIFSVCGFRNGTVFLLIACDRGVTAAKAVCESRTWLRVERDKCKVSSVYGISGLAG